MAEVITTVDLVIGDIVETHRSSGEFSFEWRIRDFWLHCENSDFYLSPPFSFLNECWSLVLDLNVLTWSQDLELMKSESTCMELILDRDKPGPSKTLNLTFAIKVTDGVMKKAEIVQEFSEDSVIYCFRDFCLMSDLRNHKSRLVPDDVLTITCALKSDVLKISLPKTHGNVICSLRAILTEGRHSDFTLKVKDREWPVHKVILESRSEYFASMFRQEWMENTEGEVRFDDIDKDVMNSVLHFIYTGEVEDVTVENVCDIYTAAHKFLLEDLKPLCIQSMRENMGTDIVCEALAIAKIYEEKDLEESALEYLSEEAERIFCMQEWKQFEENHPSIAAEILKEINELNDW